MAMIRACGLTLLGLLLAGGILAAGAATARAEESAINIFKGDYASTDGRLSNDDSQIVLSISAQDDTLNISGDLDGMPLRNFEQIKAGAYEGKCQFTDGNGWTIDLYFYTVTQANGSQVLYTYFQYPLTNDPVLFLEVYGQYTLAGGGS